MQTLVVHPLLALERPFLMCLGQTFVVQNHLYVARRCSTIHLVNPVRASCTLMHLYCVSSGCRKCSCSCNRYWSAVREGKGGGFCTRENAAYLIAWASHVLFDLTASRSRGSWSLPSDHRLKPGCHILPLPWRFWVPAKHSLMHTTHTHSIF